MDGYITIGTKLSTKELDKELNNMKRDLNKYEKENEVLLNQKAKIELDTREANKKIEDLNRKLDDNINKQRALIMQRDSIPEYQKQFDSTTYDNLNRQIISLQREYDKYSNLHAKTNTEINKQELQLNDINNKIKENAMAHEVVKNKIIEANQELQKQQSLENINNGLNGVISKVSKWGLALIGIRGAYSLISRAMSTISQQDESFRQQVEYIQWALAKVIEPLVRWILSLVQEIMGYINDIWHFFFGHDLFKGPEEFASSMKTASKSAKEIQKYLAGFDEMNILGNNTQASAGTGLGGSGLDITPKFNEKPIASGINFVKEKVKELKKNTDEAMESFEHPEQYEQTFDKWGGFILNISKFFTGETKKNIGIGDWFGSKFKQTWGSIKGLFTGDFTDMFLGKAKADKAMRDIIKGIKTKWSGFIGFIQETGFYTGVYLKENISGVGDGIKKLATDTSKKIKDVFGLFKTHNKGINTGVNELYNSTLGKLTSIFNLGKTGTEEASKNASKLWTSINGVLENIKNGSKTTTDDVKKDFGAITGGVGGMQATPNENSGLYALMKNTFTKIKGISGTTSTEVEKDFTNIGNNTEANENTGLLGLMNKTYSKIKSLAKTTTDEVTNSFSKTNGEKAGKSFSQGLVEFLTKGFNLSIEKINEWLSKLKGIKINFGGQVLSFANLPILKRIGLAKGTILNNPGRGVPIGGAIAGESGREAVLPLSDARLLEELGSTIGRYITINLTNVTELDGTTIARKMKNLTNNDNFLRNR